MRAISLLLLLFASPLVQAACPPEGWDAQALQTLKTNKFALGDAGARSTLANGLLDCLADPDPALRDGIAFEAWSTWLRGDLLDEATRHAALGRLQDAIAPGRVDEAGFAQPFSALVLAELARTDRIAAWMSPEERAALVEAAATYLESVRDYRGFAAGEGWRHGVAHGADLAMQLMHTPALESNQKDRLLPAVAPQVAPAGQTYVFGEPERLARPVAFAAGRGLHTEGEWRAWLAKVAAPPEGGWASVFNDAEGLARRHDVRTFLLGLYLQARDSENPGVRALLPGLRAQLEQVP
jgi:hypothetical protein